MHPITVETIARMRMAERYAEAERHRAVRAARAARRDTHRGARARRWRRLHARLVRLAVRPT